MNKKILVIGAGSDIAREAAINFAKDGYDLLLSARNTGQIENFSKDLGIRYGVNVDLIHFDLINSDLVKFWNDIDVKPDVILVAAGLLGNQVEDLGNPDRTEEILSVNFTQVVRLMENILPWYEEQGKGSLIFIGSVAGDRGRASNYIYGSAKAGLETWVSGVRNRLYKKNVHVMLVKPGFVATKMTRHLSLPGILTTTPDKAGKIIHQKWKKKADIVYLPWFWWWIMLIIRSIPEGLFKRLSL